MCPQTDERRGVDAEGKKKVRKNRTFTNCEELTFGLSKHENASVGKNGHEINIYKMASEMRTAAMAHGCSIVGASASNAYIHTKCDQNWRKSFKFQL